MNEFLVSIGSLVDVDVVILIQEIRLPCELKEEPCNICTVNNFN